MKQTPKGFIKENIMNADVVNELATIIQLAATGKIREQERYPLSFTRDSKSPSFELLCKIEDKAIEAIRKMAYPAKSDRRLVRSIVELDLEIFSLNNTSNLDWVCNRLDETIVRMFSMMEDNFCIDNHRDIREKWGERLKRGKEIRIPISDINSHFFGVKKTRYSKLYEQRK